MERAMSSIRLAFVGAILACLAGCQSGPPVESHRLIQHQAFIDFSGLKSPELTPVIKMQASLPAAWSLHGTEQKALYNHQQWKSPSSRTGVGAIYARLPIPVSADVLLWLGRQQYASQAEDGREIGRWTDELGRHWFEAENKKYHARGYAIVKGSDAWIVYMGYKLNVPPDPADISLAARCIETFVPMADGQKLPTPSPGELITPSQAPTTRPSTMPVAVQKVLKVFGGKDLRNQ
jgi:hypothetical protein